MLLASCVKTLKRKIRELNTTNQGSVNSNVHLQQSSTAVSLTSNFTLPKAVYFPNFTELVFALLTCVFTGAVEMPCQYCKYTMQFVKYVLKSVVQYLLLIFIGTGAKVAQISSFTVAEVFYQCCKHSLLFLIIC